MNEKYDFSRWKLLRMSWHVMFPYRPRWIVSIYILLCFIPTFFLLELYKLEILKAGSEKMVIFFSFVLFFLSAILSKIIIYHKYMADLFLASVFDCHGVVKEIDRYEHLEYMKLTLLNNEKNQQYWVYGPFRNLFSDGLKQKKIYFFYLQRSRIIVSRPEFNFDGNQRRELPDSPLLANQIYAGLSDCARAEYAKIVSKFVYHGPVKYLYLMFPAIMCLTVIKYISFKIALFCIPLFIVGHLIFMKFVMRKDAKNILVGLECSKVYMLGESESKDQHVDTVLITTSHGTIDCTYLKEETKLANKLQDIRYRQRSAVSEAVKGTIYYVAYYRHGGDGGDCENSYSTAYILLDIR